MMKGDSYCLPISITTPAGTASASDFIEVEVSIGTIRKKLSAGELSYNSSRGVFLVPLSQEDTFALKVRSKINVRCKYATGDVIGIDLGVLEFAPSLSREVI